MPTFARRSCLALTVALAVAACGKQQAPRPEADDPPARTDGEGGPPTRTAEALTRELEEGGEAAQARYRGKAVRVEGLVADGERDRAGKRTTVKLRGEQHLHVLFSLDEAAAAKVGPGQQVTVRGRVERFSADGLHLADAALEAAGPVALSLDELEKVLAEEPALFTALRRHGVGVDQDGGLKKPYRVRVNAAALTAEGRIRPEALEPLSRLRRVGYLSVDAPITDAGLADLKRLAGVPALRLSKVKTEGTGLAHLKEVRGLKVLSFVPEGADGVIDDVALARLAGLEGLEVLALPGARITDAGLAPLARLTALTTLELGNTKVGDAGLAHLRGLKRMKVLFLSATRIKGPGLVHLQEMTDLYHLDLSKTPLTDAGLEPLASLPALYHLDLSHTKVGDAGLARLAKAPRLSTLNLRNTPVTDAGMKHLAAAPALISVDLAPAPIGDAGLEALARSKTLRSVVLTRDTAKVTPEGVRRFRASLPRREVLGGFPAHPR